MNTDRSGLPTGASVTEAAASLETEGFHVDQETRRWCEQVLQNKLTREEYLKRVLAKAGVAA